jgi:hypothetical protein
VCTTELKYMAKIKPSSTEQGVKTIGLIDPLTGDHSRGSDLDRKNSFWSSIVDSRPKESNLSANHPSACRCPLH